MLFLVNSIWPVSVVIRERNTWHLLRLHYLATPSALSTHFIKPPVLRSSLSVLFPQRKRLNFIAIRNKTGNVGITYWWGGSCNHDCHTKSNKYYIFWRHVCSLRYTAYNAHAPYHIAVCDLTGCTKCFHII